MPRRFKVQILIPWIKCQFHDQKLFSYYYAFIFIFSWLAKVIVVFRIFKSQHIIILKMRAIIFFLFSLETFLCLWVQATFIQSIGIILINSDSNIDDIRARLVNSRPNFHFSLTSVVPSCIGEGFKVQVCLCDFFSRCDGVNLVGGIIYELNYHVYYLHNTLKGVKQQHGESSS